MNEIEKKLDVIQNRIISHSVKTNQTYLFDVDNEKLLVHSSLPFNKDLFEFLILQCNELALTFCVCFVVDEIVTLIIETI